LQTESRFQDRLEFETPVLSTSAAALEEEESPLLFPRVFEANASTDAAPPKLQLQLVFPESTGLRRHTLLVPETLTVRAIMEGVSNKLGPALLPVQGSSLSVDPATQTAGAFHGADSFPHLDPDTEISAYRHVVLRNTLFWMHDDRVKDAQPGLPQPPSLGDPNPGRAGFRPPPLVAPAFEPRQVNAPTSGPSIGKQQETGLQRPPDLSTPQETGLQRHSDRSTQPAGEYRPPPRVASDFEQKSKGPSDRSTQPAGEYRPPPLVAPNFEQKSTLLYETRPQRSRSLSPMNTAGLDDVGAISLKKRPSAEERAALARASIEKFYGDPGSGAPPPPPAADEQQPRVPAAEESPKQAVLKLEFGPASPIKKKTYLVPFEWTVRQTERHVIDSLKLAGYDATGCRIAVPADVLREKGPNAAYVHELFKTCASFPLLDEDAPWSQYKVLLQRAPHLCMADDGRGAAEQMEVAVLFCSCYRVSSEEKNTQKTKKNKKTDPHLTRRSHFPPFSRLVMNTSIWARRLLR
jgi:hypothetical protein